MRKLLDVLSRLVDQGNTVIVIEHNLDVVKSADWVIDLGPEGGDRGGTVVAMGTPEQVATVRESYTGEVLAPLLGIGPEPDPGPARRPGDHDKRGGRARRSPRPPSRRSSPRGPKAAAELDPVKGHPFRRCGRRSPGRTVASIRSRGHTGPGGRAPRPR